MVEYKPYLASQEWAKIRADLLILKKGRCEVCGKKGKQVHHLHYKTLGEENPEDLILLCAKCHMKEHGLTREKRRGRKKGKKKRGKVQKMTLEQLRAKAVAMDLK